jgi:hypothetical protein
MVGIRLPASNQRPPFASEWARVEHQAFSGAKALEKAVEKAGLDELVSLRKSAIWCVS